MPEKTQSIVLGHERRSSENDASFRPSLKQKFREPIAKQIITQILNERLEKAIYDKDQAPLWAREIAEEIKFKLLGSSATSVPTINVKYAPPPLKNANHSNSTYNNELLDITNSTSREKSPSRERNSRGKSPGRNSKRGKSPSLDPPKSPNSNRSRSPGSRPRSTSPRNKVENENSGNKQSQDARIGSNLKVSPWVASSLKTAKNNSSTRGSNRLSLPHNFSEFNINDINAIRERNEHWERLNNVSRDTKDGSKSGMGNFSKTISLRIAPLRPKLFVDTNNNSQGSKPMQRNPSGHLTGKFSDSPLVAAIGLPLTRSRSYNSAMEDTPRIPATEFSKDIKVHPLQHPWTMYYDSKPVMTPGPKTPTGKMYEENLQTIGTFDTVETFCRYFNWVKKPSQLELNTNFHIFKDKIKPMWEDPANANGGKWVISLKNQQLLDRCWEWLVYSLVGEELDENDDICGAVMSRRPRGDRIAVWVRDKNNVPVINGIGRRLLKILDLQNENSIGMDFQFNEDALKSGTSYNNQVYLSLESLKQELENDKKEKLDGLPKAENNEDKADDISETSKAKVEAKASDDVTMNADPSTNANDGEEQQHKGK
ncbi:1765_t:CDS:2 [Acaulospora colombiana]|uniref:1765_t:CDS:1 n=1 Tax=Acaulospora colombiana TaxID=27376 RepID=A0ACA9MHQ9_9GLOM|nr:1765_t:CDS:2 [Acaulospora colombiana]